MNAICILGRETGHRVELRDCAQEPIVPEACLLGAVGLPALRHPPEDRHARDDRGNDLSTRPAGL